MRRQHVHRDCTRTAACSLSLSRLRPGPTHSSRRARPWPIGFEGAFKPPLAPSLIHMPACPPGPDSGCRPRPPSLTASAARAQVSAPAAAVRRGGLAGGFDTFIIRTLRMMKVSNSIFFSLLSNTGKFSLAAFHLSNTFFS